jgi:hypothetical protein
MQDRVEVDPAEQFRRPCPDAPATGQSGYGREAAVPASRLPGREPSAVDEDRPQVGVSVEDPTEEQVRDGDGGLGRVPDQVLEEVAAHPSSRERQVGVDEHGTAELGRHRPERLEVRVVQVPPIDGGRDLDTDHPEVDHTALQFGRSLLRSLERDVAQAEEAAGS